jgi:hypothetical protein
MLKGMAVQLHRHKSECRMHDVRRLKQKKADILKARITYKHSMFPVNIKHFFPNAYTNLVMDVYMGKKHDGKMQQFYKS